MIKCDCGSEIIIMLEKERYEYPLWMCLKCRSIYELDTTTRGIKKDWSKSPSNDLDYFDTSFLPESVLSVAAKMKSIAEELDDMKSSSNKDLCIKTLKHLHFYVIREMIINSKEKTEPPVEE